MVIRIMVSFLMVDLDRFLTGDLGESCHSENYYCVPGRK